jgi:hypothetical protein
MVSTQIACSSEVTEKFSNRTGFAGWDIALQLVRMTSYCINSTYCSRKKAQRSREIFFCCAVDRVHNVCQILNKR